MLRIPPGRASNVWPERGPSEEQNTSTDGFFNASPARDSNFFCMSESDRSTRVSMYAVASCRSVLSSVFDEDATKAVTTATPVRRMATQLKRWVIVRECLSNWVASNLSRFRSRAVSLHSKVSAPKGGLVGAAGTPPPEPAARGVSAWGSATPLGARLAEPAWAGVPSVDVATPRAEIEAVSWEPAGDGFAGAGAVRTRCPVASGSSGGAPPADPLVGFMAKFLFVFRPPRKGVVPRAEPAPDGSRHRFSGPPRANCRPDSRSPCAGPGGAVAFDMPVFDAANAAEMVRRGALASAAARRCRREPGPPPTPASAAGPAAGRPPNAGDYRTAKLADVRAQLDRMLGLMAREADPAKLYRLAGTISKLEEIERRLSDRALPATVRSAAPRRGNGMRLME